MPLSDDSSFDATPITKPMPTASRRSPLSYYTSAAKRSFRDAFGRQQLVDALKAFLWVAPLTILIWIYAEREQLSTQKNFPVPVEVRSADPQEVVASRIAHGTARRRCERARAVVQVDGHVIARLVCDSDVR